jgi:hypothetical protein
MRSRSFSIVALLVAILLGEVAYGQEEFSLWLSPEFGKKQVTVDYDVRSSFREDISDQWGDFRLTEHDFRLIVPLDQDEREEWFLNARVGVMLFDGSAILPDTCERLPDSLWDLRLGVTYRRSLEDGGIAGGNFTIGSPSDRPFHDIEEMSFDAVGFWSIPQGEGQAWVLLLGYSNVREFLPNVPLPGAGYLLAAGADDYLFIGLPLTAFRHELFDDFFVEGHYFLTRFVQAKVEYRITEQLRLHAGFDWDNRRFLRDDRKDYEDQLQYYEKRALAGLRWDITEDAHVDLAGGYAFDRFFFEGEDYDDRGDNRIDISGGPIAQLSVAIRF